MTPDDETATAEAEAREADAEFGSGFSGKTATPEAKPEPAATPRADGEAAPEFVQITKKEWDEVRAAHARTASYDAQFSKAFGTIGNIQKVLNDIQRGGKVEISDAAFAELDRDFPELAKQLRAAMAGVKVGIHGTGQPVAAIDDNRIETMMASYTAKRELEVLEDQHPDWRQIVGAIDASREQPDPDNPFRKWLSGKDLAYQDRINATESAAVIGRAITLFQRETKAAAAAANAKPVAPSTPQADARAQRIRDAVQPRGSNTVAGTNNQNDEDAQFAAGFRSR
jgi:hypothetical protein